MVDITSKDKKNLQASVKNSAHARKISAATVPAVQQSFVQQQRATVFTSAHPSFANAEDYQHLCEPALANKHASDKSQAEMLITRFPNATSIPHVSPKSTPPPEMVLTNSGVIAKVTVNIVCQ